MSDRKPTHCARLEDVPVFMTGDTSGIGEALATPFVEQGAKRAFVDILEEPGVVRVEKPTGAVHSRPLFIMHDITDIPDIPEIPALQTAVKKASESSGMVAGLLNNAANDMRRQWPGVPPKYRDEWQVINMPPYFQNRVLPVDIAHGAFPDLRRGLHDRGPEFHCLW